MKERAEGLEKIASTGDAEQLPPGTATRMAIGAEIAPADPAAIGTVRVGAEMRGGVDLTTAPSRHDDAWWRSCGGVQVGISGVLTGVAKRLGGMAHKGFRLAATHAARWCGWRWCRLRSDTVAWPHPLEHETQPHQSDEHQLVVNERGEHGTIPSCRWSNEGILPGFQPAGISRRLEVQDPTRAPSKMGAI